MSGAGILGGILLVAGALCLLLMAACLHGPPSHPCFSLGHSLLSLYSQPTSDGFLTTSCLLIYIPGFPVVCKLRHHLLVTASE